ncbi:hypothetical protein Ddye_020346 [Dipteronia dyeriana]|uniref:Uncharacterized protein n=1 Tax=Dipteronia dyeriana TaxID=168575 RepID=A0AAD9WVW9_9ROSI|nr:hypothetical protein Ddye_020346 [Dipteronia dyeriana]
MDFVPNVLLILYIVVVTSSLMINIGESRRSFNVVDYGAVGDGQTVDSADQKRSMAEVLHGGSPNTDGINLVNSTQVHIHDSLIECDEFCTSELVSFVDVHRTSANEQAITLDCSSSVKGCRNIVMKQVNITSSKPGNEIRALCKNAHGFFDSTKPHVSCS